MNNRASVLWAPPDAARDLAWPPPGGGDGSISLDQALGLCRWLRARRERILSRPAAVIAAELGRLADRWLARGSPWLEEATGQLAATTGYASPVLAHSLRHLFRTQRTAALRRSLGRAEALDDWQHGEPGHAACLGPALTVLSAAGNVPVATPPSLFHALRVKSPVLVRVATAEPVMFPLLARSLYEVSPIIGSCVAVLHWPNDEEAVTGAILREAEAVIAYGGDASLASLRPLAPPRARFLGYGHRVGFGVIGREALAAGQPARRAALAAAIDVAFYDQQGCVSPQWFYVEEGGETPPESFASLVAAALGQLQERWPRRVLSPAEASAIHQRRAAWLVRAGARVWASRGTEWTVIASPAVAPEPGCANRVAWVQAVPDAVDGLPSLASLAPYLQTVACALPTPRLRQLVARLGPLGVTRFCPLGRTQFPPAGYHHDGRDAIAELVRWVEASG